MVGYLQKKKSLIIYFVVFDDINILDFSGPLQVFSSANKFIGHDYYDVRVISKEKGSVTTNSGIRIMTSSLEDISQPADTLMICGGSGVRTASKSYELIAWVKNQAKTVRRIVSICSGAFILAESGILNSRRVTTHWSVCSEFSRKYPAVKLQEDAIYVNDSNIWTSAGVTAGIDLCLALVEIDTNHAISLKIAKDLVLFLRRQGGQNQFSDNLTILSSDYRIGKLYHWIIENLSNDISLSILSDVAALSERSLSRLCHDATGLSPLKMVKKIRIEIAKSHLESTDMPLKSIAMTCGFKTEGVMRKEFIRKFNTTPALYRQRFR